MAARPPSGPETTTPTTLPPGWQKVPSQSRPGEFSYLHLATGYKQQAFPAGEPTAADLGSAAPNADPSRVPAGSAPVAQGLNDWAAEEEYRQWQAQFGGGEADAREETFTAPRLPDPDYDDGCPDEPAQPQFGDFSLG